MCHTEGNASTGTRPLVVCNLWFLGYGFGSTRVVSRKPKKKKQEITKKIWGLGSLCQKEKEKKRAKSMRKGAPIGRATELTRLVETRDWSDVSSNTELFAPIKVIDGGVLMGLVLLPF